MYKIVYFNVSCEWVFFKTTVITFPVVIGVLILMLRLLGYYLMGVVTFWPYETEL